MNDKQKNILISTLKKLIKDFFKIDDKQKKILIYITLFIIGVFIGAPIGNLLGTPFLGLIIASGFPLTYYFIKSKKEKTKEEDDLQKTIEIFKKKIKIVDVSQIDITISKHEKVIMEYDKNKHHDLVRLSKFIKNLETKINEQFNWENSKENMLGSELYSYIYLEKNTKNLDLLVKLNITMINKLVEDKITDFLIIYEKFEEVGVFRSSFENELLSKLDKLTNKLDNISNQLRKIDGRLGYQNLVLTYNTFQFNKIRKSLKK